MKFLFTLRFLLLKKCWVMNLKTFILIGLKKTQKEKSAGNAKSFLILADG